MWIRSLLSTCQRQFSTSNALKQASAVDKTTLAKHAPGPTKRIGVIALKKGMTAIWDEWGVRIPVTLLQLQEVYVTKIKPPQPSGHLGVQVGAFHLKPHRATKSDVAYCAAANLPPLKTFTEFEVTEDAIPPLGKPITTAHYVAGQYVDVQGTTIGKGFQGVMKRWGFKGQPATHGVSVTHRSHGSTGQCQDPGRVFPGKKMAGRMGGKTRTVLNCQIVKIDHQANVLYVRGQVPGHDNGIVRIRDAVKKYSQAIGPVPTSETPKKGIEELPKLGSDPYLSYEAS